jgi:uncharacterized protein (UPF0212 family)
VVLTIFNTSEAEHIKEIYTNVVGQNMLDLRLYAQQIDISRVRFTFKMQPTEVEMQEFKED